MGRERWHASRAWSFHTRRAQANQWNRSRLILSSEQPVDDRDAVVYQIRIKGQLDQTWSDWFTPLTIVNEPQGEATLTGAVRDQAELHGLLDKVFNLNLTLLAVTTNKTEMENKR